MIHEIEQIAKKLLADSRGSHNLDHTERVRKIALFIGQKENGDLKIIETAALLHDIERLNEDRQKGAICHATEGAKKAEKILKDLNYNKEFINKVSSCISRHRFRGNNIPTTIEEKVIFDADKIDAIGAIGIGRAFMFAGEVGARLHNPNLDIKNSKSYSTEDTAYREYKVKLSKVSSRLQTKTGRELAVERDIFMETFFKQINKEYLTTLSEK